MSGTLRTGVLARLGGARSTRDDGAAAVEFALVSLLLITLFLGIIEFSLILRDKVAVTSAVRAGGRIASAEPRQQPYAAGTFQASATGTPATVTGLVVDAVFAVATNATGIPRTSISEVWVYRADANGFPQSGNFTTCGTDCVRYKYDATFKWNDPTNGGAQVTGGFKYQSGSWDYSTINACAGTQQSVGVYLKVDHPYLFGRFGFGTIGINDASVFRFEPVPSNPGPCK
jgi:Flp pilus assembly protein TadG